MKQCKKIISCLLAALLTLAAFTALPLSVGAAIVDEPTGEATSGTTGDCVWILRNGVLTVSGEGRMGEGHPWGSSVQQAVIAEGVTTIGKNAFSGCGKLTSINIPSGVTTIEEAAFSSCTGLTSVSIPNSVTSIKDRAFIGCTGLQNISVPDSVTDIGTYAFARCTGLNRIAVPDQVTSIGLCMFDGCTGLSAVAIPNSVTSIGTAAFRDCSSLSKITIPNSVTEIGDSTFSGCSGLTQVELSDGLISIGKYAFLRCQKLARISIPDSVISIGYDAFFACAGLRSVAFGNGLQRIGAFAFSKCTGLTSLTIPDSVTSIGASAFADCSYLTGVTIGNGVTGIGASAFYNCAGITSVVIGNRVTVIDDSAFCGCTLLKSISIPDSVTCIGDAAFSDCISLTSVVFGNSVTSIGDKAFSNCMHLKNVNIPDDVTHIGYQAFYLTAWESSLPRGLVYVGKVAYKYIGVMPADTSVVIREGTKEIADEAFLGKTSLISAVIPDGVMRIGEKAFYGCTGLATVVCPDSVIRIGGLTFADTPWYDNLPNGMVYVGKVLYRCKGGASAVNVREGTTAIADYAFSECNPLTSVVVPQSVLYFGYHNFEFPYTITYYGDKYSQSMEAVFNNRIDIYYMGGAADWENIVGALRVSYYDAQNIGHILIEKVELSISGISLHINYTLTEQPTEPTEPASEEPTTEPPSAIVAQGTTGDCTWTLDNLGTLTISGNGKMDEYRCETGATNVSNHAPWGDTIKKVIINDGVTNVGMGAFAGCGDLSSVSIPDSVTEIDTGAFLFCQSLKHITFSDHVKTIGSKSFSGSGLTEISFPDNGLTICSSAFEKCVNLRSVTIPDSVGSLCSYLFSGCTSLTDVTIGKGVTRLEEGVFKDCDNLTFIVIPDNVTEIGHISLGYRYNPQAYQDEKKPGFMIYGSKNSAAEAYANENGFLFRTIVYICPHCHCELAESDIIADQAVPATCTENGLTAGSHCSVCGEVIRAQEKTDASAHQYVGVNGTPATHFHSGMTDGIQCSRCGKWLVEQAVIPQLTGEVAIGDVDGDETLGIKDATELQRAIAEFIVLEEDQKKVADTNGDGEIDVNDVTAIQKYLAEMIDRLGA